MSKLYDLPADERPRERLLKFGPENLSLQELLAIILGRGIKDEPVTNISQKLLSKFGSLKTISEASIESLKTIRGLGLVKACQLRSCFELSRRLNNAVEKSCGKKTNHSSPDSIYRHIRSKIFNYHKEHLLVVSLDNGNKIIGIDTVAVGTLNSNLIHPRETFDNAIKHHASQIIICHNHPSGELTPSEEDKKATKNLVNAGKILGIPVIDHLIITENGFFSFLKNKLI